MDIANSNLNKGLLRLAIAISIIVGGLSVYIDEPSDIPTYNPFLEYGVLSEMENPICKNGELSWFVEDGKPTKYIYMVIAHTNYEKNGKEIGFTPAKDECQSIVKLAEFIGHEEISKKRGYKVSDLTPAYIKEVVEGSKLKAQWFYIKYKVSAVFSTLLALWAGLGIAYGLGFLGCWVYRGFKK